MTANPSESTLHGEAAQSDLANLFTRVEAEGARLWSDGGSIHYRCPDPISPELRALIIANKPALLASLAVWDASEAMRLEHAADGFVERLSVPGSDSVLQELAGRCVEAHFAHDMTGVRATCALIEDRARKLIAEMKRAG
jgi:hypothetical protein